MGDRMEVISFEKLLNWINSEVKTQGTIFGIHKDKFYYKEAKEKIPFLGEYLGTPIGPAAGPHSQLTQNIVSAYLTGSRFIELKTVQILDGEDLPVSKPCIKAEDECYNVEWSTELTVKAAFEEYVKAWFLLHFLQKELNFSTERDFTFNMSVGYDLQGIKSEKINSYIDGLKNGSSTEIFNECKKVLKDHLSEFNNFTLEDLEKISPVICSSITLSTLHGCPPEEIEKIALYLLKEKHLNTFIKMNPTLLGEEFVRDTFKNMGYEYITLNPHHFKHDLQYKDGVDMLKRLRVVAKDEALTLGVKLTNTLPVKILNKELPGEEMYMSGRALYPLTINLAARLSKEFKGELLISYSGGADFFNIKDIFNTGICPITFATTVLKPGGYERINQLAKEVEPLLEEKKEIIDVEDLEDLAKSSFKNKHHLKKAKGIKIRKLNSALPVFNCSVAPCSEGCPIKQQIPAYVELVEEGKYKEAFSTIALDNPCPSITGTICNHNCEKKCTRIDYDSSVRIRGLKKIAALKAQEEYIKDVIPTEIKNKSKTLIIGAGPGGLATALYLRRNGLEVQVNDKLRKPFGVVGNIIPEFRISSEDIERDFNMIVKAGVKINLGVEEVFDLKEIKKDFKYIVLALGAWKEEKVSLKEGAEKVVSAFEFLKSFNSGEVELGCSVCVVGGGNVAMDTARAAKRVPGVKRVSIIYRRTRKEMPAEKEEIDEALREGIEIQELLVPVSFVGEILICEKMILGEVDESGRRVPLKTGEYIEVPASTVIGAIGEKIDTSFLEENGIELGKTGLPVLKESGETNLENIYMAGDVRTGAATIVEAMAGGKKVALDILKKEGLSCDFAAVPEIKDKNNLKFYKRKGILAIPSVEEREGERCLSCSRVCQLCIDVCPNRANILLEVGDKLDNEYEILHIDGMCNECGNCGVFCPHVGNPYKDKVTLFWSEKALLESSNIGFYIEDMETGSFIVRNEERKILKGSLKEELLSKEMKIIISTVLKEAPYILKEGVKCLANNR